MTLFGRRADGWLVKNMDPIIAMVPYLMPMRCDSQVFMGYDVDYESLARYVVEKGREGYKISFMEVVIAAYVRTISQMPELNRFIANKRLYARKEITASFVVLKQTQDDSVMENATKVMFDPRDTIFDVAARVSEKIAEGRKEEAQNSTMKFAQLLSKPFLANAVVGLARLLDRYGLLPKAILDMSPFHTGLFVTNMASIGMPAVRHHIYNFGTTSLFLSIGRNERVVMLDRDGTPRQTRRMPIGVCADERICAGMIYAKLTSMMRDYIAHPEKLEVPPDEVYFDEGHRYSLPPVKIKKHRFGRFLRRRRREIQE